MHQVKCNENFALQKEAGPPPMTWRRWHNGRWRFQALHSVYNSWQASKHLYSPNQQTKIQNLWTTYKGRLPEKPIRPNIAGRLAKKNLTKKQTNKYIHDNTGGKTTVVLSLWWLCSDAKFNNKQEAICTYLYFEPEYLPRSSVWGRIWTSQQNKWHQLPNSVPQ